MTQEGNLFSTPDSVNKTVRYYEESQTYLTGPLKGTCHFGFTNEGEPFQVEDALLSMELLLGRKLGLPGGSTVLDAGCGYGRVATTLHKEFGYNVVGIDLMSQRLSEADRFVAEQGAACGVELVRGNYCTLPFDDSVYSGIYTMETLVHANPLEAALSEFRRVLKPGGRLVLFEYSVPKRESLDPLRRKITDEMVERTGMASIEKFTHDAFPAILEDAGFCDVAVEDISRNVWPTWKWLFDRAIRENKSTILRGQIGKIMGYPNLAGSLFIWPYRHQLGYKVVTATKPITNC